MDQPIEHRRAERMPHAAVAAMETIGPFGGNNQGVAVVRNLSRSGIGIETAQPPLKGQRVAFRLAIGTNVQRLTATTRRVQPKGNSGFYEVGLEWTTCSAQEAAFLDALIASLAPAPTA